MRAAEVVRVLTAKEGWYSLAAFCIAFLAAFVGVLWPPIGSIYNRWTSICKCH